MAQALFPLDGESLIMPGTVNSNVSAGDTADLTEIFRKGEAEFTLIINMAMQRLDAGKNLPDAVKSLIARLHELRHKVGPAVWQKLVPVIQAHPSAKFMQQCPFTRWSFDKPRGYSGDASLIDFIYGHSDVADEVARSTSLGKEIFEYTINAPGPVAVRERREILTRFVDQTAAQTAPETEILTVAAGHLREAETSHALRSGAIKRWVALDQDPMSVASISDQFAQTCIEPTEGSVRGLLGKKYRFGTFDLIYAAGLYDYLSDKVAIRLTEACIEMLKPGGVFLFANFSDEMVDDGYMESYMNWQLLQRSEHEMWKIATASSHASSAKIDVWFGANRNILYCTITKLA